MLDGCSRAVIHWDLRESMTEQQVEVILQKAKELHPDARPRIISDNGPQFIARDFKEFIEVTGMSHVRTSPHYPQSNGKIERHHKTIKGDAIRTTPPATLDEARRLVTRFVGHDNTRRLHSAIGYVTPNDLLNGRQRAIHDARDRKLEARPGAPRPAAPGRPAPHAATTHGSPHTSRAHTRFVTPMNRESGSGWASTGGRGSPTPTSGSRIEGSATWAGPGSAVAALG